MEIIFFKAAKANISNLLQGSVAAYSLRKLDDSYSGAAIRIRRDSDNTETDIGFDAEGNLDIDAIKSFLGLDDSLPGDISSFAAGYSLRKIKSDYTGSAIRVRRSTDNMEMDIGFDSDGELDLDSLNSFIPDSYNDTLPLDTLAATAAYGLRQLSSSYLGPLVRVREDALDTEIDINFDSNGDLDINTLESFCGANNCLVTVWYDQSGNGYDVSEANTTKQPKIYDSSSGIITMENGRAAIDFFQIKGFKA